MRVLLTGASGFIGSHVARTLLAGGHEVAALLRPQSSLRRLGDVTARLALISGDVTRLAALRPALAEWRPEACLHLAWYAEPGEYLDSPANVACLTAGIELIGLLCELGCRKTVVAGTCAEYDSTIGTVREDSPTRPGTVYAASKLALKLVGEQIAQAHGMAFVWGRIFYVYGPQEDERRAIPAVIRAMRTSQRFPTTSGTQVRDYLHVHDVAAGLVRLLEPGADGVFNIASGSPVPVRRMMEMVADLAGSGKRELLDFGARAMRGDETQYICGDNQRLKATGWMPRYDLERGLRDTFEWWAKELDRQGPERTCD